MPAQVNIRNLEERDIEIEGELSPTELDLGQFDELIHVQRPLQFELTVQRVGGDIVAQGDLELTLDCECSRCLKPYTHTVKLADWTGHYPLEGAEKVEVQGDFVDLTPQIREDILLEFPQHPLCEADCSGLPNRSKEKKKSPEQTNGSSAWSALNKLKF